MINNPFGRLGPHLAAELPLCASETQPGRCRDQHSPYLPFDDVESLERATPSVGEARDPLRRPPTDTPTQADVQTLTRYGLRLVCEDRVPYDRLIRCDQPETAARFLHTVLEGIDREVFGALFVDSRHHAIGHTIAYIGTLTQAPVEPRGVLVPALLANAAALILFHNHPSGDPDPSQDDLQLTRRLVEAGDVLGVKVLDHIVLGEAPRYTSLYRTNPW